MKEGAWIVIVCCDTGERSHEGPLFPEFGVSGINIVKNAGFAFFLGATVVFPGEVFSSLEKLRAF